MTSKTFILFYFISFFFFFFRYHFTDKTIPHHCGLEMNISQII